MTQTFTEPRNVLAGMTIVMTTRVDQPEEGDDIIAFGACMVELQREGWHLRHIHRDDKGYEAVLQRSWDVGTRRIYPTGQSETGMEHGNG